MLTAESVPAHKGIFSLVSHELRTPLSKMRWIVETLLAPDAPRLAPEQRQALQELASLVGGLTQTIEILLDAAEIALHGRSADRVRLSLPFLLNHVLKEHLSGEQARVARRFAVGVPAVSADPKGLETALRLLLAAVSASSRDHDVVLRIGTSRSDVVCAITAGRDPGPRFAAGFRRRAADGTMEASPILESHRLALYVARTLIGASGGTMRVGDDPGAAGVTITLPRSASSLSRDRL